MNRRGALYLVMRLAPLIGREGEGGRRIVSVAARHYNLERALEDARYFKTRWPTGHYWITAPDKPAHRRR